MSGVLAAVDATKVKEVAKRFNIEGYPTGKNDTVFNDMRVLKHHLNFFISINFSGKKCTYM